MKHLKIMTGLLLLVQAFHPASLQNSTDSLGQTIDGSWLRHQNLKNESSILTSTAGSQNGFETQTEQGTDSTESSNDDSSGIASGFMVDNNEEENVIGQDKSANEASDDPVTTTLPPVLETGTTKQPELPDATDSPTNATTDPTNLNQTNLTEAEGEFNSTTTPQNPTSSPDFSDHTHVQTTTSAPDSNTTTTPGGDKGLTSNTAPTTTATVTTTAAPEINETPTTSSSTAEFTSETTETTPVATTTAAPNTSERANRTGTGGSSGSSSERGLASDPNRSKRQEAWGAVLGTAVAVACVGLVAYIILKKKHQKGFSHRKLVEEYPSDPVLRLDSGEPLDLNLGGSAYYNPALQGDSIQMTNFPGRR